MKQEIHLTEAIFIVVIFMNLKLKIFQIVRLILKNYDFSCRIFIHLHNICFLQRKIAEFLDIYDNPDNARKIHSKKVALTGGIILLLNLLIVECFLFLNFDLLENFNPFKTKQDLLIFSFSSFLIFLIGFIDDKTGLSANLKFLMIIITVPVITMSDDLLIQYIRISFLEETYKLPYIVSIFWTVLCFLLFKCFKYV